MKYKHTKRVGEISLSYESDTIDGVVALEKVFNNPEKDDLRGDSNTGLITSDTLNKRFENKAHCTIGTIVTHK